MATNNSYDFDGSFIKIKLHQGENNWPYKRDHAIASILNSGYHTPSKPNVITTPMLIEFAVALDWLRRQDVECAVVNWNGETTGYGASLEEFAEKLEWGPSHFRTWWGDHLDRAVDIVLKARELPMHTISAIRGRRLVYAEGEHGSLKFTGYSPAVLGGSVELPLAFKEVFVGEETLLGFPESGLSVVPGLGGVALTYERTGRHNTEMLVATAGLINGEKAFDIGMADQKAPNSDILKRIYERIESGKKPFRERRDYQLTEADIDIIQRRVSPAPLALREIPHMMDRIEVAYRARGLEGALRINRDVCFELGLTDDFREGVMAFKENRQPIYTGK